MKVNSVRANFCGEKLTAWGSMGNRCAYCNWTLNWGHFLSEISSWFVMMKESVKFKIRNAGLSYVLPSNYILDTQKQLNKYHDTNLRNHCYDMCHDFYCFFTHKTFWYLCTIFGTVSTEISFSRWIINRTMQAICNYSTFALVTDGERVLWYTCSHIQFNKQL